MRFLITSLDEINELFDKIKEDNIYELRDKCIFELLYSSGLRISEACNLKMEDVDLENMAIAIEGKGGKARLVPFGEKALNIIQRYLEKSRPEILKIRKCDYIFVSKKDLSSTANLFGVYSISTSNAQAFKRK